MKFWKHQVPSAWSSLRMEPQRIDKWPGLGSMTRRPGERARWPMKAQAPVAIFLLEIGNLQHLEFWLWKPVLDTTGSLQIHLDFKEHQFYINWRSCLFDRFIVTHNRFIERFSAIRFFARWFHGWNQGARWDPSKYSPATNCHFFTASTLVFTWAIYGIYVETSGGFGCCFSGIGWP